MPGPAAALAAENSEEIAQAASDSAEAAFDSNGFNVVLALGALAFAYYVFEVAGTVTDAADDTVDGAGDAGQAAGRTVGDTYEGTQDVARGTGDAVSDAVGFVGGGTADVVRDAGGAAGDTADYFIGGAQDTVEGLW